MGATSAKLCTEMNVKPYIYDQGGLKTASPKPTTTKEDRHI